MARFQVSRGHKNGGIFIVVAASFVGCLLLFGWQTWEFVNFLFPDDQLLMKLLTLFSFDVMCLIWSVARQFYHFAHPHAKGITWWGKWVTFVCSLVASIIYMVLQSMFRFHLVVSPDLVNLGYAVSIVVLVFNILMMMGFLSYEISTRYPNEDEYELVDPRLVGLPQPMAQARLANNQDFNLIEEEEEDEQIEGVVDGQDEQVEIPYTHNGPAKKSWGGPRRGSGRKGK